MTIRKKLLMGFVAMAIIGVSLGVVGLVSSKTITNMSDDLNDLQFKYNSVGDILNAHYVWRQGLTEAVLLDGTFTGSIDPNNCALGKWFSGDDVKSIKDSEILAMLAAITEPHQYIHLEAASIVNYINNGNHAIAEQHLVSSVLPKTQEVITILENIESRYVTLIEAQGANIGRAVTLINTLTLVLLITSVVACTLLVVFLTRNVVKPLVPLAVFMHKAASTGDLSLSEEDVKVIGALSKVKDEIGQAIASCAEFVMRITHIGEVLTKIADGDLNVEVEPLSETDIMANALQNMIGSLNAMFSEINTASSQVTVGASQVANSSQSLAQGSTEQAASVHQLSVSVNEITDKTKSSASMAEDAAEKSMSIRDMAEKGNEHMCSLVGAVTEIHEAGESINKIIKVIDDIAFQTNILALNAAVEAARAGQHGKGFAVVAEEVRNLAAKSAGAAKDTASMIESTIEKSNLGLSIATDTAESLREIVDGIEQNVEVAQNIARISEEQTVAISQINIGIDQVSQVIQQNSATAQESAATSEELSGQATSLQALIGRFKLKDTGYRLPSSSGYKPVQRIPAAAEAPAYEVFEPAGAFGKY